MAGFRKANVLNLIRYHYDQNHTAFRDECRYIMQLFEQMGDLHIVDSIRMMLECEPSYFVPMYKGQPWTYSGADEVRMGLPPVCGRVESPIPSEHGPRFLQPTGTAHTSVSRTPAPSHGATSALRNIPAEVANASNFELVTASTPPTQYNAPVYGKNNTIASREPKPQLQYLEPFPLKKPRTNLQLPSAIQQELDGLRNALRRDPTLSKFLFQGPPGTGKTEMVVQLAQSLGRELYCVDFTTIVDSKLGQTQKNLVALFHEIEELVSEGKKTRHLAGQSAGQPPLILFDELDALALDRVGSDDLREMGRVTSILLRELDRVSSRAMIIATTNLFQYFDKALVRRFDAVVDFSRYTREDLLQVAESFYDQYLHQYQDLARNTRLFKKIIANMPTIPYPGELKNLIRTSMAFSSLDSDTEYLSRLYLATHAQEFTRYRPRSSSVQYFSELAYVHPKFEWNLPLLKEQGYSLREIEILTGIPKSTAARMLGDSNSKS